MTERASRRQAADYSTRQDGSDDPLWGAVTANTAVLGGFTNTLPPPGFDDDAYYQAAIRQVVFIDGNVPDAQLLANGVASGVMAVILAPGSDGIQQIAAWLTSHAITGLTAIDIVAHGEDGTIALGNAELDSATLGQYTAELATIGAALQPGGDIQIYGCDVAQDAAGVAFLDQLSVATGGASVAAASHLVGAAAGGGSWTLDVNTGSIAPSTPFTSAAISAYPDELTLTTNQLFAVFAPGSVNGLTRLEQLGVTGATVSTSGTVISDSSGTSYLQVPIGLAIDAPLQEYFYVDYNAANNINLIGKGSLSGGAPTTIYSQPDINDYRLGGIALDQPSGTLYFALGSDAGQGVAGILAPGIYKLNIVNNTVTAVATTSNGSVFLPTSLALDIPDNLVFFTDTDTSNQTIDNLDVANIATGTIQNLTTQLSAAVQNEISINNPDEASLGAIAVDTTTHTLFFTANDVTTTNTAQDFIFSVHYTVSGGNVTLGTISTLYSGTAADQPTSIGLDTQHNILYIGNDAGSGGDGNIYEGSMTPSGGASLTLVYQENTTTFSPPYGLVLLSTPTVVASGSLSYVHNAGAITLASTATVSNADGQNLAGAIVSVAGGTAAFGDTLAATVVGNISASYNANTETLTLSGNDTLAHYQQVLDSVTFKSTGATGGPRTIDWTVTDGVITSPTATSTVTVHDAPVVTAGTTVSFTGGGSSVVLDSGLTLADSSSSTLVSATVVIGGFVSGDTLTVGTLGGLSVGFNNGTLTLSGSASIATYKAALDSVSYNFTTATGDPTVGNTNKSRTISWSVNDGVLASAAATSTLNVIHSGPTITAGATATYAGGSTTPVVLDSSLVLTDSDSGGNISSATITVGGSVSGDTLNYTTMNNITGAYANGVMTLTGVATVADYQAALRSITYIFSPTSGDPTGGSHTSRTITWSTNDGVVASNIATSTLSVVHEPPVVTAGGSAIYPENASPIVLDSTLAVTDPDSGGLLSGATVRITSGFLAGDTLNWTDQTGITGNYNAAASVLTFTGSASIATYQTLLQSVAYSFAGDPTNHLADNNRTIGWTVTDGVGTSTVVTSSLTVLCFCKGTRIATPDGEVPVEHLSAGDRVVTANGAIRPIVWVGVGRQLATRGKRSAATPVIVAKGALGPNLPHRDLHLTKAHALAIDDVLIPVEFLVNHRSIRWDDRAQEVALYHIELESHDVLLANGAPAESYRDDGNRWLFQNASAGWSRPPQAPCAPVLTGGEKVDTAWRRFLDRSGPRRLPPLTEDPDLHLLVDGQRIEAATRCGRAYVFRLPHRPASVRIASRDAVPAELGLVRDPRSLGVALRRITLRHAAGATVIEAADGRLADGFHGYEPAEDLRWTNGDAGLPGAMVAQLKGGAELVLHLAGTTRYPLFREELHRSAA